MMLPLTRLPMKTWRIIGWIASLYLAVVAFIQLITVLFAVVPTGYLSTNTNLFISGFDTEITFERSLPTILILILGEMVITASAVVVLWFTQRAAETLPYEDGPVRGQKRFTMISRWHQAAIVVVAGGLLSSLIGVGQRFWLWNGIIQPFLTEEKINYAVPSLTSVLFSFRGLVWNAATVMMLLGIFIILFFEKLETPVPAPAVDEVVEPEDLAFEEPPATTGMIALQALPGSIKEMPADMKSMPVRLWRRAQRWLKDFSS
ncbi:hypothetical protein HMPREF0044_0685 [Gleimia coleocanis DSM 15436]|uniref:Uncharacterized protein n=1 Tax=Gleimia coleocanis DSM 15436 TaxID=525245 RepID=C0W0U2_9ACTO|nr:hypothetical protein [Gleimia coleocanis]EEH63666.1 hypothetical protein HMPREF0044_0685 [Gleimia coleocanis DSM 15436]